MRLAFSLLASLFFLTSFAQDIDFDKKTGLTKVDGKESFYVVSMGNRTYSVQNLDKKELIFVSLVEADKIYIPGRPRDIGLLLKCTFTTSGNTCVAAPTGGGFNFTKGVANTIAKGRLVSEGTIPAEAERRFVVANYGTYTSKEPLAIQVSSTTPAAPVTILVKGSAIYNNEEGIGKFRRNNAGGTELIQVYDRNDQKMAEARRPAGNTEADWTISLSDGKSVTLLYNPDAPLERLFKFLVEKNYLR